MTTLFPKFIVNDKTTSKVDRDIVFGDKKDVGCYTATLLQKFPKPSNGASSSKKGNFTTVATLGDPQSSASGCSRISSPLIPATPATQKIETREDILALPLNPCLLCGHYKYLTGYCGHYYRYRLPEPARECRCVHYKPRMH